MVLAIGALLVGLYVPEISTRLQLVPLNPLLLALIALATGLIIGSLELRKRGFNR